MLGPGLDRYIWPSPGPKTDLRPTPQISIKIDLSAIKLIG